MTESRLNKVFCSTTSRCVKIIPIPFITFRRFTTEYFPSSTNMSKDLILLPTSIQFLRKKNPQKQTPIKRLQVEKQTFNNLLSVIFTVELYSSIINLDLYKLPAHGNIKYQLWATLDTRQVTCRSYSTSCDIVPQKNYNQDNTEDEATWENGGASLKQGTTSYGSRNPFYIITS